MSATLALLVTLQLAGMTAHSAAGAATARAEAAGPMAASSAGPVAVPAPRAVEPLSARRLIPPALPTDLQPGGRGTTEGQVEYSDWYYRRLDVHRWGSYAMLPLFIAQYVAGSQLESGAEDNWAEDVHPLLAGGVAVLFASNTVTGVWNLWEGRKDPRDRKRRFLHASLMLLADAGFVATGILADEAEDDGSGAGAHKTVAIASMSLATISWAIMLDTFRPD